MSKNTRRICCRPMVLWLLVPLYTACSIVEPHPDLTDSLRAARMAGGVSIENPSRLTLPPMASITVEHADGRADHQRLLAVQTGLATYFSITPTDAAWQINVHWPDGPWPASELPDEKKTASSTTGRILKAGTRGLESTGAWLVRTADRDAVIVDVVQVSTQTLVTRLRVEIQPWLRGRDWDDPVALTRAFMAVGAALAGA